MNELIFDDILDSAEESILFGDYEDAEDMYLDPEYFSNLDDCDNPADDLFEDNFLDSQEDHL
ncbi:hypothetical protein HWC29_gp011 [Aeromonas phage 4_4572]|nr:hypothetical protein HWC29_gp011 [Aeromonas phage 4_4572]QEG09009.1 hypothetical protein [Aeromonas phage 4_4572]